RRIPASGVTPHRAAPSLRPSKPAPWSKCRCSSTRESSSGSTPAPGPTSSGPEGAVNQREIRRLAELLREYSLTEIEIEREGVRVRLRRETGGSASAPSAVTGPAPRSQGEDGA